MYIYISVILLGLYTPLSIHTCLRALVLDTDQQAFAYCHDYRDGFSLSSSHSTDFACPSSVLGPVRSACPGSGIEPACPSS